MSSRPAPRKATSGPKVFVSYSVADARVAALVKNQLRAHGVEPLDPATLVAGSGSIDQAISSALASSDAVVSIVSDAASSWADAELGIARRKAVPILPIAVGIAGMPQGDIAAVQLSKSPTAREVKEKLRAALDKYLPNDFLG